MRRSLRHVAGGAGVRSAAGAASAGTNTSVGRLVTERCVPPDRIVVPPPALDGDLGFAQRVEALAVEELVAQASIEGLDVAVLPGTLSLDIGGPGADGRDPFLQGLGPRTQSNVIYSSSIVGIGAA